MAKIVFWLVVAGIVAFLVWLLRFNKVPNRFRTASALVVEWGKKTSVTTAADYALVYVDDLPARMEIQYPDFSFDRVVVEENPFALPIDARGRYRLTIGDVTTTIHSKRNEAP